MELLVVIAIIGILIAMLLPAVQQVRESARRTQCLNNLRQMSLACATYSSTFLRFPPGGTDNSPPFGSGRNTPGGSSWMAHILPNMDQNNLFEMVDFPNNDFFSINENGDGTGIQNAFNKTVPSYRCPSSNFTEDFATSPGPIMYADYVGISGHTGDRGSDIGFGGLGIAGEDNGQLDAIGEYEENGVFFANSETTISDISDGASNTMLISEVGDFVFFSSGPKDIRAFHGFAAGYQINTQSDRLHNCTTMRHLINPGPNFNFTSDSSDGVVFVNNFPAGGTGINPPLRSAHPGGVNGGLGDGSSRFLSEDLDASVLAKLSNKEDGLTISEF